MSSEQESIKSIFKAVENDPSWQEPKTIFDSIATEIVSFLTQEDIFGSQYRNQRDYATTSLYNQYVEDYTKKAKTNRLYRNIYFWSTFSAIILLSLLLIASYVLSATFIKEFSRMITIIASSTIVYISGLFAIVEIIAKHIFPLDTEKYVNDIAKAVIHNDLESRKFDHETYFKDDPSDE